jgi:hypothetical protein
LNKFRAKKTALNGLIFDSQLEARRFGELSLMQKAGAIRNLERQVPFQLSVNSVKVCKMIVDHVFFEGNTRVLEETKSKPTKTPVYRLKVRLLKAIYPGIVFREYP